MLDTADFRAAHPEFPWGDVVGMRNRIVHAYDDLDPDIVACRDGGHRGSDRREAPPRRIGCVAAALTAAFQTYASIGGSSPSSRALLTACPRPLTPSFA